MRALVRVGVIGLFCGLAALARAEEVPVLVKNLKSDDVDVRRGAAKELAEMGPKAKDAAQALLTALKSDKDLFVRRFAAQALGQVGADPKTAVPALAALLTPTAAPTQPWRS